MPLFRHLPVELLVRSSFSICTFVLVKQELLYHQENYCAPRTPGLGPPASFTSSFFTTGFTTGFTTA
jgi:hypothetical protein